jgi:putative sensory transduction regulator
LIGRRAELVGGIAMKFRMMSAIVVAAFLAAAPARAGTLPETGITRAQVMEIMTKRGLPARIDKDSKGVVIVKSTVASINFDVYFYDCAGESCREIQFAAGWTNNSATAARINEWNTTKRLLRVYSKPGKIIWAEQDIIAGHNTTENIGLCLSRWTNMITQFKGFMNL